MSITAKELAKLMGLSEAAISMALNNKPGVSTKTRKRVLEAAEAHGYDFSRISPTEDSLSMKGTIYFVVYRKHGAVIPDSPAPADTSPFEAETHVPFFSQLSEGIDTGCRQCHYYLNISYLYEEDNITEQLVEWKKLGVKGILLLGTELDEYALQPFIECGIPLVLIDNYFESININCVLINNVQGAYLATDYLIRKKRSQPGYLCSSYPITSFEERSDGFYKAIRKNGMSTSRSIVHKLTPSMEGAYSDMLELLDQNEPLAKCYFADNDQIAAGAIKALKEKGHKVPGEISVIGFDDMPLCNYINPPLTTIHVPKQYMGELSVKRLDEIISTPSACAVKIEIDTELRKRKSV